MSTPPEDKSFHYTDPEMIFDLLVITPFGEDDEVLDAGSGDGRWARIQGTPLVCELDDGCDFYTWDREVDWVIGNPPYHESWKFTEKAISIARRGVAWLVNTPALNSHFTPRRLDLLKEKGFSYTKIHVVNDRRWHGRYFYIILEKDKPSIVSWSRKNYSELKKI